MNKEDASMLNKVIAMGYIVENPEYKTSHKVQRKKYPMQNTGLVLNVNMERKEIVR